MKNSIILFVLGVCCLSCNQNKYPVGIFPEEATNLSEINSPFDDVNSDMPAITFGFKIVFSSNRINSQPHHFNLVESNLGFYWDKSEGYLGVDQGNSLFDTWLRDWVRKTETNFNEKGPYTFIDSEAGDILLFSRDNAEGVYSIFIEPREANSQDIDGAETSFRLMGDGANEMYPSFYGTDYLKGAGVESQGRPEKMLFSSDHDGAFDIYEVDLPAGGSTLEYLQSAEEKEIQKIGVNTNANDHMPFVYGDMLVFSSDRPGGLGGYDLYYSFRSGDGWTEPENFGPKINSEFDEYRPVVSDAMGFENQVMIFSSDRPGGLGGFDLYFVGIPKF
ncbi:TolB-like translocation protein [Algoriphagus namhaensis]